MRGKIALIAVCTGALATAACAATTLRWRAHAVPAVGLSFDVIADLELYSTRVTPDDTVTMGPPTAEEGHLTQQRDTHGGAGMLSWKRGRTLAWWREDQARLVAGGPPVFGPVSRVTICGRPAERQESTSAGSWAHVSLSEDQRPGQPVGCRTVDFPGRTTVAVAFEHRGVGVVADWTVDSARREALRGDEAHFFASIRCE